MDESERLKLIRQLRIPNNWSPDLNKIAKKIGLHYKTVKRFYEQRVSVGGVLLTVELLSDQDIVNIEEDEKDDDGE